MNSTKNKLYQTLKKHRLSRLVAAFMLFWIPVIIFSKLANEIVDRQPIGMDNSILTWIHSLTNPIFDGIFLFFTTIGNIEYILPITLLIVIYLLYKKQRLYAIFVSFGVGGAALSNLILKLIFQRSRPNFWHLLITETGYSFPSGHAMMSSALILCIMVILWKTRWKWPSLILGLCVVGLIGVSRLYLGVHYPTDVIAGWSVSLAWIVIVFAILKGISYELNKPNQGLEVSKKN